MSSPKQPRRSRTKVNHTPSRYYLEALAVLEGDDFPTPKQVYDLIVHDQVARFLSCRIEDWLVFRLEQRNMLPHYRGLRIAKDDNFSIGLQAIAAEECAALKAKLGITDGSLEMR